MNAPFKSTPVETILADACVGISELKKNPSAVIAVAQERQVAILNRNKPVAYLVSPEVWDHIVDVFDDLEIAREMEKLSQSDYDDAVEVSLDDL